MPIGHAQARRKSVSLNSLAGDAFILYPRHNGRALFDSIVSACQRAGFSPRVLQVAPQLTSVVNLVATGIGVSITEIDGTGCDRRGCLPSADQCSEGGDHAGSP
jgi:DNA-binding transcriptional LysR family regulator